MSDRREKTLLVAWLVTIVTMILFFIANTIVITVNISNFAKTVEEATGQLYSRIIEIEERVNILEEHLQGHDRLFLEMPSAGKDGKDGAKGDTGEQGPEGKIGPQGPQGEQGIPGKPGLTPKLEFDGEYWWVNYGDLEGWQLIGGQL
jgi:hypothetical protein